MKKLFKVIFAMLGMICFAVQAFSATNQVFGVISMGSGSASSSSFSNTSNIGQGGGESDSSSFRSYGGALALQTKAPVLNAPPVDGFQFSDPSPTSDVQVSPEITFAVTLSIVGGANTIKSASYGISHTAGVRPVSFRSDAIGTVITSGTKIRYQIAIPNGADTFLRSDNNWIWWSGLNDADASAHEGIYQVKVLPTVAPTIVITQPDAKGGFAGTLPQIAATVTAAAGVDASSVQIRLDASDGTNVLLVKTGIYDAAKGVASYKYAGTPLVADATYRLTVSASDAGGTAGSATLSFVVKGGAIADLVPYPSPCDPKVQPITIRYILNKSADVTISIYDTGGHLVRTLLRRETRSPGINEEKWYGDNFSGADLANGIYFCEIVAKDSDGEHRRYTSLAILGK
ncbi:MAG: hypothetical protein NTU66_06835 [Elusimicrobia bacterium]|nr:hypothetical protein [Elusimicrobiota bacterium]